MKQLESGGGIFGLSNISLVEEKEKKLGIKNNIQAGDK